MDNRKNPSHLLSYSVILIIRLLVYRRIQKLYNINKLFKIKPLDLNNIQKYLTKVLYGTEWIIWSLTPKYRGRDRMVIGFTSTYAIIAYHHCCCELESRPGRGLHHHVIKFVSDLQQVGGFLRIIWFPPLIKLTATI